MPSSRKMLLLTALCAGLASNLPAQTDTTLQTLRDVTVTGTRGEVSVRDLPESVTIIPRQKLTESYRTSILPTLSEQVPGLFVTSRGLLGYGVSDGAAGGINVRGLGSGSGRVLVLIDGHPQYMGLFGHSIADSYQTLLAREVQVVQGPSSVLYGSNAMGGVVNILTRQAQTDGVQNEASLGYGSYNTLQSAFTSRLRHHRLSGVLALSYDRTDGHRPRLGFEQYGGYAKAAYAFTPHWNAYADLNLTHFNASYPGTRQAPVYGARQWITRGVTTAVVENKYKRTSGALSFYYNWGRHKINDGHEADEQPQTAYFRSNDQMWGITAYQNAQLFNGNLTTVGADYQHVGGKARNADIETGKTTSHLADRTEDVVAAYVNLSQRFLRHLVLNAGLRVDHEGHTGTELIPKGSLAWQLPAEATVKLSVGKGFRRPNIRELYMFRPANADLKPERMVSYELGFSQRLLENGSLSYELTAFIINGSNIIQTVMGQSGPQNVNTGHISNRGMEAAVRYRMSPCWSLSANYSALHMKHHVVAAPEHKLFVGTGWNHGKWKATGGLQYVAGLFTQVGTNETKENFWLLNLSAAFRPMPGLEVFAKGENLLAQRYETNYGYPMPKATFTGGVRIEF